jgi:hypothetical protein
VKERHINSQSSVSELFFHSRTLILIYLGALLILLVLLVWIPCSFCGMESLFYVEAKKFVFSVVEGASVARLEERRRNFSGLILLSTQSVDWLFSTVDGVLWFPEEKDYVRSFREGSKVLIVRRGGNAAGRFLEVAVFAAGGRRGVIFIPEGNNGRGWSRFGSEVGKVRDFFKASARQGVVLTSSSSVKPSSEGPGGASGSPGSVGAPSYADVLRKGISCSEKEIRPPLPAFSRGRIRGVHPKREKERLRPVSSLGKDPLDRCGGDKKLESLFLADVHQSGDKDMLSSLLLWRRQLEDLKADVDRALSRVREGLLLFGPGSKPKVLRRNSKKGPKKNKGSRRWVPKSSQQNRWVFRLSL